MKIFRGGKYFFGSRSGKGFLLHLSLCALLCGVVGIGVYNNSLNWFIEHKGEEKRVALQLVDSFVTNYSGLRSKLGADAPVPATFRAHSIEIFNKKVDSKDAFRLSWVGRPGKAIRTLPLDDAMAASIEALAAQKSPQAKSAFLNIDGRAIFRTVYPSYAREQSCVSCHNKLQPDMNWRVDDLMGAFAIDVPVEAFLKDIRIQSVELSLLLFLALGAVGLVVSRQNYLQMRERESAAAQLGRARKFLDTILENIPAVVTVRDAKTKEFLLVNRGAEELAGKDRDAIMGKRLHDVFPTETADLLLMHDKEALRSGALAIIDEHEIEPPNAAARAYSTKTLAIPGEEGEPRYILSLSEDITRHKQTERIAHLVRQDGLTGLPNRLAFGELVGKALEDARRLGDGFSLICIDLDRFKEVNDVFGHPIGDALLIAAAQKLSAIAEGASLCRIGGDEFTMIASGDRAAAERLTERLQAVADSRFEIEGHILSVGLSVGVAMYPTDAADAAGLISNADAALYRAKSDGRGRAVYFDANMGQQLRDRRAVAQDLRSALDRGEFSLHFQPQAKINGDWVGFEALIRWRHPTRGLVPPSDFVMLAEENGMILPLGEWVLRQACREAASWPPHLRVAVNVSPVQIRHGDLPELVLSALLESGLAPHRLELEITESAMMEDLQRAMSTLQRLKAIGVRVAIDDFGTGYSSLAYLQALSVDTIKIDRSFITNVLSHRQSAQIVRAVIGLARELKLPVVAEGVENQQQLDFLRDAQCDEVQGYFIGRPQPISAFGARLGKSTKAMERMSA